MDYIDTVMRPQELVCIDDSRETNTDIEASLIKQAEITGKIMEQEGMRKVVKWIESQDNPVNISHIHLVRCDWQAQKKDWGLL